LLHCGHFPNHLGDWVPQLWQKKADCIFFAIKNF